MSRRYRVLHRSRTVDANQAQIVAGLRALGFSVQPLSAVGKGVPDLLVGGYGMNILLEVKDPAQDCTGGELRKSFPRAHGGLNEDQFAWHRCWRGQVAVVRTLDDALEAIRKHCEPMKTISKLPLFEPEPCVCKPNPFGCGKKCPCVCHGRTQ